jgi:hypothetical protein
LLKKLGAAANRSLLARDWVDAGRQFWGSDEEAASE